jgi:formate-dependent nitrite reductase membrane component NrfD
VHYVAGVRVIGVLLFLLGAAGVAFAIRIALSRRKPLDLIAALLAPVAVVVAILGLLLVLVPGFLG